MRPEEGKDGASPAPAGLRCVWPLRRIRGRVLPPKGGTMDAKNLLWFAAGFRTVAAWRDAMFFHGYSMPAQLCHGLSGAMKRLKLTFPEAFCLLWVKKKIGVSGRALLYDPSAAELWDAGPPPAAATL